MIIDEGLRTVSICRGCLPVSFEASRNAQVTRTLAMLMFGNALDLDSRAISIHRVNRNAFRRHSIEADGRIRCERQ
jgi:hypothetical protein